MVGALPKTMKSHTQIGYGFFASHFYVLNKNEISTKLE
jgi:hypothetical protein